MIYADTNFLTQFYIESPDANEADRLLSKFKPMLPVTWLLRIELINAFEQCVFSGYGAKQSRISHGLAATCQQHFRDDLRDGVALRSVELSNAELSRMVEELSLRHTAKHGFRTYDLVHVASALLLKSKSFWSYDVRAVKLAKLEGLKVLSLP